MDRDQYNRIKEHEKERLRAGKRLKQIRRRQSYARSAREALADMLRAAADLLGESDAQVEQLARRTAQQEARLEVAREFEEETPDAEIEDLAEKQRARDLVRQLKSELDVSEAPEGDVGNSSPAADLPDKTIGRMSASEERAGEGEEE